MAADTAQDRRKLVGPEEAGLALPGLVALRDLLHPPDLLRLADGHKDRRPRDSDRQFKVPAAHNDRKDRLIQTAAGVAALEFRIGIVVARPGIPEDRPLSLPECGDILDRGLVIPGLHCEIQVKEDLRLLYDRLINLVPELRERIAGPELSSGVIVYKIQPVLKQLAVSAYAGVLHLSVVENKRTNPVKIRIKLLFGQGEVIAEQLLLFIFPGVLKNEPQCAADCRLLSILFIGAAKARVILRRRVIETVAFRVQYIGRSLIAGDPVIQDPLLVGEPFAIREHIMKKRCRGLFRLRARFAPPL